MKPGQQINYITYESYLEDPKKLTTNTVVKTPEQNQKELEDKIAALKNECLDQFPNWTEDMDESYKVVIIRDGPQKPNETPESKLAKYNQTRCAAVPDRRR